MLPLYHFSLQMQLSKRWPYKHGMNVFWNSLLKKTVILKQPFPCSWYSVTFTKTYPQPFWQTFWMLNRIQDYDVLKWCKWHNSCRKRVEITWPFFYDLIAIREKKFALCSTPHPTPANYGSLSKPILPQTSPTLWV